MRPSCFLLFAAASVAAVTHARSAACAAPAPPLPAAPPAAAASEPAPAAGAETPPTPPGSTPAPPIAAPPPAWGPPSFASDPLGAVASAADLTLKMYGDTGYAIRDHANQPWPTAMSNPNVYAPGVWNSFFAPRLDLFGSADVSRLAFLTEVMFEGLGNNIGVDIERIQVTYLVANWLRLRAGRSHLAFGYYNDTYHHGNFFELTTSRPYSVNFEDSCGIIMSHNVGAGFDGTVDVGGAGSIRYDFDVGNGRAADVTAVALQYAETNPKSVNLRLRWMPIDGLILGVNGMRDVIPPLASPTAMIPNRPTTEELVAGAHAVYTENHVLLDIEGFAMRHNPDGAPSTSITGGFAEVGYTIGSVTPYFRAEYIHFPSSGDIIFQFTSNSAEGALVGYQAIYTGFDSFTDLRAGFKWVALPQLAVKLEVERLGRDAMDQEIATVKVAFGF